MSFIEELNLLEGGNRGVNYLENVQVYARLKRRVNCT